MRVFIALSRNIYNQDKLKIALATLKTNNAGINKWISGNLRNYLINKYEIVTAVTRAKKTDPDWVKNAVSSKDLYEIVLSGPKWESFLTNIEHAIGYLRTVRDPSRVSVEDAIRGGNNLIALENKKASDVEDENGIEVLYKFPDGYKWVNVVSKQSLEREGKLMQHCVGSEKQNYINGVKNKTLEIWSLRDEFNKPHCTIEYITKTKRIKQIKGKNNRGVIEKYVPYAKKFLDFLKRNKRITKIRDLNNIGVLDVGGTWYDLRNLPDNMTVSGDLDLNDLGITSLPEGLKVIGNLDISNNEIVALPKNLEVNGLLTVLSCPLEHIPEGVKLGGLTMWRTAVKSLPKNLRLSKKLTIRDTEIKVLPEGLYVGESVYVEWTVIEHLASGIVITGDFIADHSKIKSLPEDLKVGGDLYLSHSEITELPENFKVGGTLDLDSTELKSLPKGLEVGGDLIITNTKITSLPEDLHVTGSLNISGLGLTPVPKGLKIGKIINRKPRPII